MAPTTTAPRVAERPRADVLNRDFLEARARILDLAAALDRYERAPATSNGTATPDPRLDQLRRALEALLRPGTDRAEAVQQIFSLDYDPAWRSRFELDTAR